MKRTNRIARAMVAMSIAVILELVLVVCPVPAATAAGEVGFKVVIGSGFSEVDGYGGWVPGTPVSVSVDDPGTDLSPDLSTSASVDSSGSFTVDLRGILQLHAGDTVTAVQGSLAATNVVTGLLVLSVDPGGLIQGTAAPGSALTVTPYGPNGDWSAARTVTADPSGHWSVNFAVVGPNGEPPFDIRTSPVHGGGAFQGDPSPTQFNWSIPRLQVSTLPDGSGQVALDAWMPLTPVVVSIDDPHTSASPDFTAQVMTDSGGQGRTAPLPATLLPLAGDLVTASSSGVTATTIVTDVQTTSVDPSTDSVSGRATPGSTVTVSVFHTCADINPWQLGCSSSSSGPPSERDVVTDGDGHWSADFAATAPGPRGGPYDIREGTNGAASEQQGDGGSMWGWMAPRIDAMISEDRLGGGHWSPGTSLNVTVARAGQSVFTGQASVDSSGWWDLGLTSTTAIQPGDTITASGASQTAVTTVSGVTVQSVNATTDVVAGVASPGSNVWVLIQGPQPCDSWQSCIPAERLVTADAQGNWAATFATAGPQPGENSYDLVTGSIGFAMQVDRDGDTQASWAVGATVQGTVTTDAGGTPIGDAVVSVCGLSQNCRVTRSNGAGHWSVGGLSAGHYTARVMPPNTTMVATILSGDLAENATLTLDAALAAAQPLPNGVTIVGAGIDPVSGVPMVLWRATPVLVQVRGPSGCTGTWTLTVVDDMTGLTTALTGSLVETPPGSGIYVATIYLGSLHGRAHFSGTLICEGQPPLHFEFDFYIDPSGTVVDTAGNLVADATVTLLRQDTWGGPFTPVPEGSAVMSPGNRTNPDTSNATGAWGWDVVPGTYKVRASKAGCTSPTDPAQPFVESDPLQIPPPVTGLTLVLACPAPTKVDTTALVVSSVNPSAAGGGVTFTATVSPATATGTVRFTLDGNTGDPVTLDAGHATYTTSALTIGAHQVLATYSGDAAHLASVSPTIIQTVNAALRATMTTITNDREDGDGSSTFGDNVKFTATVRASSGRGTPTGSVQFSIDGINMGGPRMLNRDGKATYSTTSLSAGNHTVIATYSGSATLAGSSSTPFTQVVNKAASKTVLTCNPDPSMFGQSVTLTALVTPSTVAGTVQFKLDGTTLDGPVTLDATGRATLAINKLTVGTHTVTAVYGGNVDYRPSTGTCRQLVTKAATHTVVTSSGTPANRGTTVVFTATVTAVAPGSGTPAGTIQFRIDGVNVGAPVALDANGLSTYPTSTLTIGRHSVTAIYNGSSSFGGSTGPIITERIQ